MGVRREQVARQKTKLIAKVRPNKRSGMIIMNYIKKKKKKKEREKKKRRRGGLFVCLFVVSE